MVLLIKKILKINEWKLSISSVAWNKIDFFYLFYTFKKQIEFSIEIFPSEQKHYTLYFNIMEQKQEHTVKLKSKLSVIPLSGEIYVNQGKPVIFSVYQNLLSVLISSFKMAKSTT